MTTHEEFMKFLGDMEEEEPTPALVRAVNEHNTRKRNRNMRELRKEMDLYGHDADGWATPDLQCEPPTCFG